MKTGKPWLKEMADLVKCEFKEIIASKQPITSQKADDVRKVLATQDNVTTRGAVCALAMHF